MSKKQTTDNAAQVSASAAESSVMQARIAELEAQQTAYEEKLAQAEVEAQKAKLATEEAERLKAKAESALATAGAAGESASQGATIKDSPVKVKVYCKLPGGMRFPLPDGTMLHLGGASGKDTVLGMGVTRNVPYPVWEYVKEAYGKIPAFSKGLIFATDNASEDMGEVREKSGEKSGFEGVDPKNPGQGIAPVKNK